MYFLKGLIIGFTLTAPIGPVSMLCILRTMRNGLASGFISGVGAAVAYALCGITAALLLPLFLEFLIEIKFWLRLAGGIFLIYLGALIFLYRAPKSFHPSHDHHLFFDFSTSFLFTLSNPMSLLSFLAVFASFGLSIAWKDFESGSFLLFGIFLGSALWWLILSESLTIFRHHFTKKIIFWINRATGLLIFCIGIFAILTLHRV